jgi:putative membrane protein
LFEQGFLQTDAPFYMDLVTTYFAILPFLLLSAIIMAMKKRLELHYKMQLSIFIFTLVMVVIFEIGVRISGGFAEFMKSANVNETFMLLFLVTHILIALASVVAWSILIYSAVKEFKLGAKPFVKSHKKLGMLVYAGMSITSFMGVTIYYLLFIY